MLFMDVSGQTGAGRGPPDFTHVLNSKFNYMWECKDSLSSILTDF